MFCLLSVNKLETLKHVTEDFNGCAAKRKFTNIHKLLKIGVIQWSTDPNPETDKRSVINEQACSAELFMGFTSDWITLATHTERL